MDTVKQLILDTPAVEIAVIVSGLLLTAIVSRAWIRSRRKGEQKP